jgi:hypothetical protein
MYGGNTVWSMLLISCGCSSFTEACVVCPQVDGCKCIYTSV